VGGSDDPELADTEDRDFVICLFTREPGVADNPHSYCRVS
jgi:hypothetical protein